MSSRKFARRTRASKNTTNNYKHLNAGEPVTTSSRSAWTQRPVRVMLHSGSREMACTHFIELAKNRFSAEPAQPVLEKTYAMRKARSISATT